MPPASDLFIRINDFARSTPWLHAPATAYAKYGIVLFAGLIIWGWWQARSRSAEAVTTALLTPVATVAAFAAQQVVVALVHEERPYAALPHALVLVSRTTDPSFPSDHACVTAAVAAGLFLLDRRLGSLAAVMALVMAVTRVYVGAHWPLDVVAGLALGAIVGATVALALRLPVARLVRRLSTSPLRPLLAA